MEVEPQISCFIVKDYIPTELNESHRKEKFLIQRLNRKLLCFQQLITLIVAVLSNSSESNKINKVENI